MRFPSCAIRSCFGTYLGIVAADFLGASTQVGVHAPAAHDGRVAPPRLGRIGPLQPFRQRRELGCQACGKLRSFRRWPLCPWSWVLSISSDLDVEQQDC